MNMPISIMDKIQQKTRINWASVLPYKNPEGYPRSQYNNYQCVLYCWFASTQYNSSITPTALIKFKCSNSTFQASIRSYNIWAIDNAFSHSESRFLTKMACKTIRLYPNKSNTVDQLRQPYIQCLCQHFKN